MFLIINSIKRILSFKAVLGTSIILGIFITFIYSQRDVAENFDFIPRVMIVDETNSEIGEEFIEFLVNRNYEVEVKDTDIYYNVIVLDTNFENDVTLNESLVIDYYGESTGVISLVEFELNLFHQIKLGNLAEEDLIDTNFIDYEVSSESLDTSIVLQSLYILNYVPVLLFFTPLFCKLIYMKKFNNVECREDLVGLSIVKRVLSELIALFVILLIPILFCILADVVISGYDKIKVVTMIFSYISILITMYIFALLINSITTLRVAIMGIGQVIQLLFGSTSGSWFLLEFLPSGFQKISKVNPLYWVNRLSEAIYTQGNLIVPIVALIVYNVILILLVLICKKVIKQNVRFDVNASEV